MNLGEDTIYGLKNTPKSLLKDIAKVENIKVSKENLIGIGKIKKNISEIKNKNKDNSIFIKLMSKLDSNTLTNFILDIDRIDKNFLDELLKITNDLNEKNSQDAVEIADKLITLYRMNMLSIMFSENRLSALELALKNYK